MKIYAGIRGNYTGIAAITPELWVITPAPKVKISLKPWEANLPAYIKKRPQVQKGAFDPAKSPFSKKAKQKGIYWSFPQVRGRCVYNQIPKTRQQAKDCCTFFSVQRL
jgi:hypothetical protein